MSNSIILNILGSDVSVDMKKILNNELYIKNAKYYLLTILMRFHYTTNYYKKFTLSKIENNIFNILFKDTLQLNILVDGKYEKIDILIHFKIELSILEVDIIGITKYSIKIFTDNNGYLIEESEYINEYNDDKKNYHSLEVSEHMFKIFESKHKSLINNYTEILY